MPRYSRGMKICLVEDDLELGRALQVALQDAGHETLWVRRVAEARPALGDLALDAAILDIGLPDGDGLSLLRQLRTTRSDLPVVIVTARSTVEDRVNGLDLGADDFLVKPFAMPELLARLRAVARRSAAGSASDCRWSAQDLTLDDQLHLVTRGDEAIKLSPSEYALLLALLRYQRRVVTRRSWSHACSLRTRAKRSMSTCRISGARSAMATFVRCAASATRSLHEFPTIFVA